MPVECGVEIDPIGQERFHALDKDVMRQVFNIHNSMGRFCDERIYQEELARRCRAGGLSVEREVPLRVTHLDFSKSYYIDLLVERGGLYELKAVAGLDASHEKQAINYLLLAGLRHGKLVNMRPSSVEYRFISTTLSHQDRLKFNLVTGKFNEKTEVDRRFHETLGSLFDDWGAFLDANLYRKALLHFSDSSESGLCSVNMVVNGLVVGTQEMCVLDNETIWHLSAVRKHLESYETHLLRLLHHTAFNRMHWVNLDQRNITLRTLLK